MSSPLYIGLISGTSMDGVDCALIEAGVNFQVVDYQCHPLPPALKRNLLALCSNVGVTLPLLGETDIATARCFAEAVQQLLAANQLPASRITALGSHGQTIWHQPPRPGTTYPFTLQLGDPNTIAALTGITTVADFRRRDMAAGGQGAPIVPALHRALFSLPGTNRMVLNLGGIANITVLPADNHLPYGFDTGPASVLLDGWIDRHQGLPFDDGGAWAATGTLQPLLLQQLMLEPYLQLPAPKSTGRELFNLPWLDRQLTATGQDFSTADVQATLLEFTALSVAQAVTSCGDCGDLIVCGGGARNLVLLARIAALLPHFKISTSTEHGLHADCVEAAAFAWFASLTLNRGKIDFSPFTGASGPVVAGGIYYAD